MKVGISTATFFLKALTEDSFSVIQRCGGEVAEVFLSTRSEYTPEFGALLASRKGNLPIYSVHSLNTDYEPQLFNASERVRGDAETVMRQVLEVGRLIGAKNYTFHGQARLKRNSYFDPVSIGKRLAALDEIANEYGITLCLENVHWAIFNSPDFYVALKDYAPNIGTVLDIKQAWQSGYDWREYLNAMGKSLKNVHLSDVKDGEITMVGKGEFPFAELISRLKDNGYDGPLIIEQYAKNFDSAEEVAESVEYLKNLLEA